MGKFFLYVVVAVVVSFYLFPFGFTFLPPGINTKNLLALVGIPLLALKLASLKELVIAPRFFVALVLAILFSLVCFIAVDVNHTEDYGYATYVVSFLVWSFGAFTVSEFFRWVHGEFSFKLLVYYLAAVCAAQCVLALCIDRIPLLQMYVDAYVNQGQEFLEEVDRLYGIGASLDPAGVRFAVVLILIAALVTKEVSIRQDNFVLWSLLIAFVVIGGVGNMISRTTILGVVIGLFYFVKATGIFQLIFRREFFRFYLIFGLILLSLGIVVLYYYNSDKEFYVQFRFAFEAFFNFVEKGEFRTDSTDKLNGGWVWPEDTKTWVIGTGLFDNWIFNTDIGYCRFILYCGLSGFSVFALFFVYNAAVFGYANPEYRDLFFFLLCMTFIIWVKVSTDIYQFYALFYCLDYFYKAKVLIPGQKTKEKARATDVPQLKPIA